MHERRQFLHGSIGLAAGVSLGGLWTGRRDAHAAGPAAVTDGRGAVLAALLAQNREKSPGRQRGSANHLSMGLLALSSLGGTSAQLQTWGDEALAKRKNPFPTGGPTITAQNWRQFLGNMEAVPGFRAFFADEIVKRGVAATLRSSLPHLMPGLTAVEFHCMIRTAYGVRFGDAGEVAVGLAYWAGAFLPLGPLTSPDRETDPLVALARIRGVQALANPPRTGTWTGRMHEMTLRPEFASVASSLRITETSLAAIARAMMRLFIATNDDFLALHPVTGTHAYRVLEAYLPDPQVGRSYLWQAMVAYYLTLGSPLIDRPRPATVASSSSFWTKIASAAIENRDDHSMKLADSAREESQHYREPAYARIAAFRLGLV
jgi:hypothetical protein